MHRETVRIGDDTLTLETGRLAPKADGAVVLRHRETFILATVAAGAARPDADFLPLTVDYRERQAALGRIPGNYFRRETRADEAEILTSRLIDRAVRPLFDKGLRATVQIDVTVHAADPESDLAGLALTAAAAACQISGLPFQGPIAGLRLVQRDGALANAGSADTNSAELDVVIAVGRGGLVMLEGEASERPIDEFVAAIEAAQMVLEPVLDAVDRLGEAAGKPRQTIDAPAEARKDDTVRAKLLAGERADGRTPGEVRPIEIEAHPLSRAHGSAIFGRGLTQALVSATLGTAREGVEAGGLFGSGRDRYLVHYNFPGFAAGEPRSVRGPGRRELGHGRLARRALAAVLPSEATWSGTARVVSDIISSDGSSSMATVCGASLALLAAGVPISAPVAGVAMGLVRDDERAVVLTDLTEAEDHAGDIDLKVAGTATGLTALQLDTKPGVVPIALIRQALEQAETAIAHILGVMTPVIDGLDARPSPARHAIFSVAPGRVGQIIGSKGRTLDALQGRTQTRIDVSRSGVVTIVGDTPESVAAARAEIEGSAVELRKDGIYRATVRTVRDYGALVRIGDHDGLVHVSEWGEGDHSGLSEGDTLLIRVLGADRKGRIVLSRKAAAGASEADALN